MEELLERAVNDPSLNYTDLGYLLRFYVCGPWKREACADKDFSALIANGYIQADETHFFIPGTHFSDRELLLKWTAFYTAFKGVKGGVNADFEFLKKQFPKGAWKVIVMDLETQFHRQVDEKDAVRRAIEFQESKGNRRHGMFVAPWKNLRTYLHKKNRGWEESFPIPDEYRIGERVTVDLSLFSDIYRRYYLWATQQVINHGHAVSLSDNLILSQDEFNGILNGSLKAFTSYQLHVTDRGMLVLIGDWQKEYLSSVTLRQGYARLVDYCAEAFRRSKTQ